MVKEAQANMGILLAEQLQLFQKDQTQGIFAGADGNQTMLQLSVLADFLLADGQLLKSQGNVFIKLAAFRCKCGFPCWSGERAYISAPAPGCSYSG